MGIFSTNKKQITLIYNSNTSIGKQTYAYVSDSKKEIRTIDTVNTSVTPTQWAEIANKLDIEVKNIINPDHPDFKKLYSDKVDLKDQDWLTLIAQHPQLVKFSVLIKGENFYMLNDPTDFLKFIEPDSAGVSRDPANEKEK
ncbi:ArsC/Spx/MgsR family protein [Aquimarina gracilis]|uniref:ArsC/Spx/MgsR family protein n=1 Tax=Aquimarina gracilis TaxID=874422 RepID=A0ABU5ZVN4_9FLAO|nr:ArsC/Spx/MgsR family protein [Aquimarina gracilis]MEB3345925.1 ArsC/Spx/MgsR family protein [Aquimarina gracilis]